MPITDCGAEGCDDCDVCRYLNFLEWAGQVSSGGTIQRNPEMEKHMDVTYPNWRISCPSSPPVSLILDRIDSEQ